MPSTVARPPLRIDSPHDLFALIPYLLGFHPESSAVLIGIAGGQVSVTVRLDLADFALPQADESIVAMAQRGRADTVFLVLYGSDTLPAGPGELPFGERVTATVAALEQVSIDVLDAFFVAAQRFSSYLCADPQCCPAQGQPVLSHLSAAAASAVYAGMVAAESRDQLGSELLPDTPARRAQLAELLLSHAGSMTHRLDIAAAELVADALQDDHDRRNGAQHTLPDEQIARHAAALRQPIVRDRLWMAIDDGLLEGTGLWASMARLLPSPHNAAPLFLFAWAIWRTGNCTLARLAAQRSLDSVPSYSAAAMLLTMIDHGLDPAEVPRLSAPHRPRNRRVR